ncbi:hypothetical protein JW721_01370 [Candidatus Micrarchaeota archaeon]|nr:hypothetical protein [Candidatus Micrarchaeota archaeon]
MGRALRSQRESGGTVETGAVAQRLDSAQEFEELLKGLGLSATEIKEVLNDGSEETIRLFAALEACSRRASAADDAEKRMARGYISSSISGSIVGDVGQEKFSACEADICIEALEGSEYDRSLTKIMIKAAQNKGLDTNDPLVRALIVMSVKDGSGSFLSSAQTIKAAEEKISSLEGVAVSKAEDVAGELSEQKAMVVPKKTELTGAQRKLYLKNMGHLFKTLLNLEMVGRDPDSLDKRLSSYERMNAKDKKRFREFVVEELEAAMPGFGKNPEAAVAKLSARGMDELAQNLGLTMDVPPEFGAQENFRRLLLAIGKYVQGGKYFDMEGLRDSIKEAGRALNNYLELSSSSRADEWNLQMQEAFLAVLQAKGEEELAEVRQKYTRRAAAAVRLAERLRDNRFISELMVDSTFGYDWEEITNVKAGEGFDEVFVVPGGERENFLKEGSSLVKLARLHKYVLSSPYFIRDKAAFIYTIEGGSLAEIEKSLSKSGGASEEAEEEKIGNRLIESPRRFLGTMDLLTQYVFCSTTWKSLKNSTLEDYVQQNPDEADGKVKIADLDNDVNAKADAIKKVLDAAETQLLYTGRAGHLGLMLNAIPLAVHYSNSYNEVVDILGTIGQAANNISNTNMYSHLGSGRVLWYYSMVQVPRNFMEANMDNYDQLVDLMSKWPTESGYIGTHMRKDMFEVRTVGEMLRRFMHVYARRSGAVRPGEVSPHRAPQDFSLVDIADRRGYDLARFARAAITARTDDYESSEELRSSVEALMESSSDPVLTELWNREPSLHDAFFDFFRPVSVELVPQKRYAVVPMIPMSHSKLLRMLSGVEGVPRYIPGWDIAGVGAKSTARGAAHGLESSTGEEAERDYRGSGTMKVFGPEQAIAGTYSGEGAKAETSLPEGVSRTTEEGGEEFSAPYQYTSEEERHAWRAIFEDVNAPGWVAFRGYAHGELAQEESKEAIPEYVDPLSGEGVERYEAMSKVEDKDLVARLEHYARTYDTDGVTLVMYNKEARKASVTEGGETEVTADTQTKDLRAFTWGKIKGNWYRIGYMDLEPENLQRLFGGLNLDGYAEFRQISGKQQFESGSSKKEMRPEEQEWSLYGALIGFNLTNIFTGGSPGAGTPSVAVAGEYNAAGKRSNIVPGIEGTQNLPSLATQEDYDTAVREFAVGASILFKGELGGMERPVCFVTGVGRNAKYKYKMENGEYVLDAQGNRIREELKQGRGGGGVLMRAGKPIRKGGKDKAMEMGAAVEESWGDDVVGATFAWQDKQLIANNHYNIAIANIVPKLGYSGLLGTMHTTEELEWFLLGDMRILSKRAEKRSGQHSHAGEIAAVETRHLRIQESVLWQRFQNRWTLEKITSRLAEVEAELQELRSAGPAQKVGETRRSMDALGKEISAQDRMDALEREEVILRRMQTAIGLIEAQTVFGTASVLWDFMDEKARAGIEALWGGPDQWSALLNSYIEVDDKFAAAFNIQPVPWGSMGGKIVIPFSAFILAATAGEYMRKDLHGPNVNVGATVDPAKDFGIGAIIGGMMRKGAMQSESLGSEVEGKRNVIEGMVLGWVPAWEGARAQGYVMLAKEKGTNNYVLKENLDINRLGAGARLLWVGKNGVAYTVDAEWLRKKMASEAEGKGKLMKQGRDTVGLTFEAKGHNVGGRARGVVEVTDRTMNSIYQDEKKSPDSDPTNYKRVRWGVFADLFLTF